MTFLAPLFFAGLLALLGPWILHRFNREDPPETDFPSTQFLEATRVPVSRQKRLRHLGLFSLRTLFLLLACLLFAQPYCSTDQNRTSQRNTFVVLDRSASMQTGDRWDRAVAETANVLSQSLGSAQAGSNAGSSSVQLFDLTGELNAHGELSADISTPNSVLRSLNPSFEQGRYGVMMQQLDALASRSELPVDVVFITDAQRANLPLQRRRLRTTNIEQLSIKNVADGEQNIAVRANASSADGVNVSLSAQVLLSSSNKESGEGASSQRAKIVVSAGAQSLATESLTLQLNEPVTVVINELILPSTDTDQLNVRITQDTGDDQLSIDSSINVPVQQVQPIAVGVRALGMQEPEDAALFVRTALTTNSMARLIPFTGDAQSLSSDAKHWVVFVPAGAGGEVIVPPAVSDFVSSGGNVLMVLQANPDETNESLDVADYIGSVDVAHPLALGELDWQETQVYSANNVVTESSDRVLMRTGQGLPLMLERNITGNSQATSDTNFGRLLIVTDPLDGIASDMPLQSSFVDWVSNIVSWFDASVAFPTQLNAGESVALPANAQVIAPNGDALRSLSDSGKASRVVLRSPGVHTIVTNVAEHAMAVTVPWEESNLETLSEDYLEEWSSGELLSADAAANEQSVANSESTIDEEGDTTSVASTNNLSAWWPWLLPLLALSLIAESLLANRRLAVRREGV